MQIVKQIPMKSHLKKWLVAQYEIAGDRIILNPEERLSKRLYGMFQYYPIGKVDERVFKSKEYLNVQLTDFLINHHRTYVSHRNIIGFNDWVAKQMNEELYASLFVTGKRKGDKKLLIEAFMDKYDMIEGEDINYDSLKRNFDRYQSRFLGEDIESKKVGVLEIII